MPPRKAAATAKTSAKEAAPPLLGPEQVLAALAVKEPLGELPANLLQSVQALVEPCPLQAAAPVEPKASAVRPARSTRTPTAPPPASSSSRARTKTADAAAPTPAPAPAPPKQETIRFGMQLVNALLNLLAAPGTASAAKETIAVLVDVGRAALGVLRRGLKESERVGVEKACVGLAGRLGGLGAKEAALSLLRESRPLVLGLYASDPVPGPLTAPTSRPPSSSTVPQTPARRRLPSTSSSTTSSRPTAGSPTSLPLAPLPTPSEPSALPAATANLLLSFSSALLALAPLHPSAPAILATLHLLSPAIPPATLPPLLMPLVRALSSPPVAPTSTPLSVFNSRSSALDVLQLVHTLKPAVFWDQIQRFSKSFLGKCSPGQDEYALVSAELARRVAWSRPKGTEWRQGKEWDEILQIWRVVASKAGEVETLQTIVALLGAGDSAGAEEEHAASASLSDNLEALNIQESPCPTPAQTPAPKLTLARKDAHVNIPQALAMLAQISLKLESQLKKPSEAYDAADDLRSAQSVISRLCGACPTSDVGPVARGLERLRRACAKHYEAAGTENCRKAAAGVLDGFVRFTESAANAAAIETAQSTRAALCDLVYSSTDVLLLQARTTFAPAVRSSHSTCLGLINRALALLSASAIGPADRAKLKRFSSGTAYHFGGKIYKEGRAVDGIALLQVGCVVAAEALRDWESVPRADVEEPDAGSKDAQWLALADELGKRWELLGTVWLKKGDKTEAYKAYLAGLLAIPPSTFLALAAHASTLPPSALVALQSPPLALLFSLLNRLTIVAHFDLALPAVQVSIGSLLVEGGRETARGAVGALLEYQIRLLKGAFGKDGVGRLAGVLIEQAETVYGRQSNPIRRLRILSDKSRLLASCTSDDPASLQDLTAEIEACAASQDLGEDDKLSSSIPLYVGTAQCWLSLLAHATAAEPSQVVRHAMEGVRLLRIAAPDSNAAAAGEKQVKTPLKESTRQALPATARKRIVRGALPRLPPKAPTKTPKRSVATAEIAAPSAPLEDVETVLELLDTTANLLGFLGEAASKIQVLKMIRCLTQHLPPYLDVHVAACGTLGAEYTKISKITRASVVFAAALPLLDKPRKGYSVSPAVQAVFLLRYAAFLAYEGQVDASSAAYTQALDTSLKVQYDPKLVGSARLREKTAKIERAAMAHEVAAALYQLQDDLALVTVSLSQAHRLWNSAVRNVARLAPRTSAAPAAESSPMLDNPFQAESPPSAVPSSEQPSKDSIEATKKDPVPIERRLNAMGARTSEGLLNCLLSFSTALVQRGSPREADLYLQQLGDLATNGGSPTMAGRALARRALLSLQMGKADEAASLIEDARAVLHQDQARDHADLLGIEGRILETCDELGEAQAAYDAALDLVMGAETSFEALDMLHPISSSAGPLEPIFLPLLAGLLRQKALVLLGSTAQGSANKRLSGSLAACASTPATLSEDLSHDARQILQSALDDFNADLTMSSLTESSISIPMGFIVGSSVRPSKARKDANLALARAEAAFCKALEHVGACGRVQQVREACLSLGLLRALQTSMGQDSGPLAIKTARCLDYCSSVTLRRELLEAILHKTPRRLDDLSWPAAAAGPPSPAVAAVDESDDDERPSDVWGQIASRGRGAAFDQESSSSLPADCCVITITVSDDLTTLFISRRAAAEDPIVFSLPLDRQGRREGEDEHFSFPDATDELAEIIARSNDTARNAKDVDSKQGKLEWWAERRALDKRIEELLDNIEFCWLGAFKSIFNRPSHPGAGSSGIFKTKIEDLFARALSTSRKSGPQVKIDDNLLDCFATLRSTSRDEELEDLVYFILDLYQVHGQAVALAEVDVDQLVIDVRTILEDQEHQQPTLSPASPAAGRNIYLVLDRHCQPIPWESLPSLRGQSITRIPSTPFLDDRVLLAGGPQAGGPLRPTLDHRNGLYILNPGGDLVRTQKTFAPWTEKMDALGWTGIVGRAPSEEELVHALQTKDVVVYFGHGGAEQYVQSRKVRHLRKCATVMLWGCSSGHLMDQGEFDRTGVPWNYMVAGCPSLIANLWDVTDRDIDRLSEAVLGSLHLDGSAAPDGQAGGLSTAQAVAAARTECKLRFLTGAAPVVYGVPVWAA